MKNCPVCGKKVKNHLDHCPYCGANLYADRVDTQVNASPAVHVKKIRFDFREIIVIGCVLVACLGLLIYKTTTKKYVDESSVISEIMVEDLTFKARVSKIDNAARSIDQLVKEKLEVKDSSFSDLIGSSKNEVIYKGDYTLQDNGHFNFEYVGNTKKATCGFNLAYKVYVEDYSQFEEELTKVEGLLEGIGETVLTEYIPTEKLHEAFIDYYNKYNNIQGTEKSEEDLGYVSISECYSFVHFEEDDNGKYIQIEMTYEPCEVKF